MSNEKAIAELLAEIEANTLQRIYFRDTINRLARELRERIEREQVLWAFVDGCRCQRNRPAKTITIPAGKV